MKRVLAILLALSLLLVSFAFSEEATLRHNSVVILYTNDVHCGVTDNIGYAGLAAYKKAYEKAGNDVLLVDCGDAIQGDTIGTLSQGEYIVDIMNELDYAIAIPGNHEFDYGMDRFFELVEKADFTYLSANFVDVDGNPVFDAYKIVELGGRKIAFVGVTTPESMTKSNPAYFRNENGETIYDFCAGNNGANLYAAVQTAVDAAIAEGAEIVVALTHLGIDSASMPYTSSDLIMNTTGIDVVLDAHSHSVIEGETVLNAAGEKVILSSTGAKLQFVGTLTIGFDEKNGVPTFETALHSESVFRDDDMTAFIDVILKEHEALINEVVAHTDVTLAINDPSTGMRMIRSNETNLGDLCADAWRAFLGADVAFVGSGSVRAQIEPGDITYGDIISILPYNNNVCLVETTGQQILDALEFGSRSLPDGQGGFLQVSGLTYEIDVSIPSSVTVDDNGTFVEVSGERRVKNVTVGGEPIDSEKTYTLASTDYIMLNGGDGYSMFMNDTVLKNSNMVGSAVLNSYITEYLGGVVGEEYADVYGQGRITIIE